MIIIITNSRKNGSGFFLSIGLKAHAPESANEASFSTAVILPSKYWDTNGAFHISSGRIANNRNNGHKYTVAFVFQASAIHFVKLRLEMIHEIAIEF